MEVRTLLWVRSRELMGDRRSRTKAWVGFGGAAIWTALVWFSVQSGVQGNLIDPEDTLRYVATTTWPLWALLPAMGNGSGEVVPATRLAPYPMSSSGVFYAGWATALVDVPYLLALPVVLAFAFAAGGFAGLACAIAFAVGASAVGQVLGWLAQRAVLGRRGKLILIGATGTLGLLSVVALLTGTSDDILPTVRRFGALLPGEWLVSASQNAATGGAAWFGWLIAMALPVLLALRMGPRLARGTHSQVRIAAPPPARPWGSATWMSGGSHVRALTVVFARSAFRATTVRVSAFSLLVIPLIRLLPTEGTPPTLEAVGAVAAVSSAATLGINAFSYDSGGALLAIALPALRRDLLAAKFLVIAMVLASVQTFAVAVAAVAVATPMRDVLIEFADLPGRVVLLASLSMLWSVTAPAPADHDSVRTRATSPRAVLSFLLASSIVLTVVGAIANQVGGWQGSAAALALAAVIGTVCCAAAARRFSQLGAEKVAYGVLQLG